MARKRMIDPDIWQDEKLSQLDFAGRLFFIGLITQSNDYGKLRGNHNILKSIIFPYEKNIDVEKYIDKLVEFGMIIKYRVNQETFLKLKNWDKYQTLIHPAKDNIPEPDDNNTISRVNQDNIKSKSRDLHAQVKLIEVKLSKANMSEFETSKNLSQRTIGYFNKKFKDHTGIEYPCNFAKDITLINKIVKQYQPQMKDEQHTENFLFDLIDTFFIISKNDNWLQDKLTIGIFYSSLPKIILNYDKILTQEAKEKNEK